MKKIDFQHLDKPFIIAEMSGNHNHDLERALNIVKAAKDAGADAIKLQTYTADTMTIDKNDGEFFISDDTNMWKGQSLYALYQKAYTPWEWQEKIFNYARDIGIIAFSTPFDLTSVDFLENLAVPCYKIASFENIDIPLIRRIAQTGKPIIASTGMTTVAELSDLVTTARAGGCTDLTLLKCTSNYPSTPAGSNIRTIPHMKELFNTQVGLSDHTLGNGVAVASIALGAMVIEKHFTLSRADGGVDAAFSLEPAELKQLVRDAQAAYTGLGHISYEVTDEEKPSLVFRRSLYIVEDMKAGDIITAKNMRSIRPGLGLAPKYYDLVLGRKVKCDVARGTALSFDLLS